MTKNYINYQYFFDKDKVYIKINSCEHDYWEYYITKCEYKSATAFDELEEYIDKINERNIKEREERDKDFDASLTNVINISDFKILYECSFPNPYSMHPWGALSYVKEGESKPTIKLYWKFGDWGYDTSYTIKDNKIIFEGKRYLYVRTGETTGREYDAKHELNFIYDIEVEVSNDLKAKSVILTLKHSESGNYDKTFTSEELTQSGTLPAEYFSAENNTTDEEKEDNNDLGNVSEENPNRENVPVADGDNNTVEGDDSKDDMDNKPAETEPKKEQDEQKSEDTAKEDSEYNELQDPEECAEALYKLDLFKGTEKGYELEKEFTREETATMLVRLPGEEEEVVHTPYASAFKDVENGRWSVNYIMYCYQNQITKGTGLDMFSPERAITAEEFITLLMRTLGYGDTEDGELFADVLADKGAISKAEAKQLAL